MKGYYEGKGLAQAIADATVGKAKEELALSAASCVAKLKVAVATNIGPFALFFGTANIILYALGYENGKRNAWITLFVYGLVKILLCL